MIALVAALLVVCAGVGGTLAYLVSDPATVTNTFTPAHVSCAIDETLEDDVKSDVKVQNTGDVDAYIRAMVIVNWADANGNVLAKKPDEGVDYSITWKTETNWKEIDGAYYYKGEVASGENTAVLFTGCKQLRDAPEDPDTYTLQVTILADAIQADGTIGNDTAVYNAWGHNYSGSDWT